MGSEATRGVVHLLALWVSSLLLVDSYISSGWSIWNDGSLPVWWPIVAGITLALWILGAATGDRASWQTVLSFFAFSVQLLGIALIGGGIGMGFGVFEGAELSTSLGGGAILVTLGGGIVYSLHKLQGSEFLGGVRSVERSPRPMPYWRPAPDRRAMAGAGTPVRRSGHALRIRTSRWVSAIFFVLIMGLPFLAIAAEMAWESGGVTRGILGIAAAAAALFVGLSAYVDQELVIDDECIEQVRWSVSGRRRIRMAFREIASAKAEAQLELQDVHGNVMNVMWNVFRGVDNARLSEKLDEHDLPWVQ